MKKFIKYLSTSALLMLVSVSNISAKVTFNEAQAKADISALLDPVANVLMFAGFGLTLVSIGLSYMGWAGKDDEEKQAMPFSKTIKKHVVAYILFGLAGVILKWFTIS